MVKLFALLVVFNLALPAMAEDWHGSAPPEASKPSFSKRHPKIFKFYRLTRSGCIKAQPYLQCGAHVAQIVLPFLQ